MRSSFMRRAVLLSAVFAVGAGAVIVRAVHDTGVFELEGNATTTSSHDWDQIYADVVNGTNTAGARAKAWTSDNLLGNGPSLNATIFTGGGSKDPSDVSQWAWKDGAGGLPDKDNLLHAFAARYTAPAGDVLFFGSDRFDNSGDAQQGFWFFQNAVSTGYDSNGDGVVDTVCPQVIGGGTGFCDPATGAPATHRNGDLLVISDFSNGGGTSTITVYVWNTAVSGNLQLLATSNAANCATAAANDAFCGIVNPGPGLTASPWAFLDKSGNSNFLNGEFYEGGINLSALGLASECFATVGAETRSSTSTTAQLKDFVIATFGKCTSGLTTTPSASTVSIGTGIVSGLTDSATLTITGASSWTGTLKFFLCGPDDLTSQATCLVGGTQVGANTTISSTDTQPFVSSAATVTKVGLYCWRGEFVSGTTGVPNASDASAGECFTVTPVTPAVPTQASPPIVLGGQISDDVNLSGTATRPGSPVINGPQGAPAGGTLTFRLYGPSDPSCTAAPVFTSAAIAVNGDGLYSSGSYTPTQVGTYRWIVSYSGDAPNTNGNTGICGAANESVLVRDITSATTAQNWLPNDVTTITSAGGSALNGTVVFTLYAGLACGGTVLYVEPTITLSNAPSPAIRSTSNTSVKVTTTADVSWKMEFTSSDSNVGSTSKCEVTSLQINNNP
jgi:hypothetical protein